MMLQLSGVVISIERTWSGLSLSALTLLLISLFSVPSRAIEYRSLDLFDSVFERIRSRYVDSVSPQFLLEHAIEGMVIAAKIDGAQKSIGYSGLAAQYPDDAPHAAAEFGTLFERIRRQTPDKILSEDLIVAAINSMLAALDPHSSYMTAQSFGELQAPPEQGVGGTGIELTIRDRGATVVTVFEGGPAATAGIGTGDIITYIGDDPVEGLTLPQVVAKLRGPIGSNVRLRVRRPDATKPIDVVVTRAVVRRRSAFGRRIDDIVYVRIAQFNAKTTDATKQILADLQRRDASIAIKGYILDLRNNEGGLLDQAVAIADLFLERGEIVTTHARKADEWQRYSATKGDFINGRPLIIFINGNTAGASEIVAGALQDHRRATLVGTRSFGYGSLQTIIPLGGQWGALKLTTSRYYTPSGRSIQAKGIVPDIEVIQDVPEDARVEAETKGEAGLRAHLKADGEETSGSQVYLPSDSRDDKALQMAIGLIRGTRKNPAFPANQGVAKPN